ncbi:MAG: EamA family transporter [Alphaproteobacteria bacterium]|jgi:inner membrane transporter RhtA|nr:EamA family transporter [Rhodospirillaceae bacterium]MDG2480229.1 EamA family transporter [Alphaproteobacteria bacterium]MBT6204614.1 EamA family transporter [Rhodospirillaceae bacterium]MBT6511611.1 EamA family transporter [Rhodospirillaceae bacterium]MBT7611911.1 EamA family transporter [Rhodospirillaceae bacterium]
MSSGSVQSTIAAFGQRIPAPLILIFALAALQVGSGTAKSIMTTDNVFGLNCIRLALGGMILALLLRPRVWEWSRRQWIDVGVLGLAFTAFNVTFYLALIHLPLGLVATVGFLGPLTVSVIGARRFLEFAWPILAFCGVCMLAPLEDDAPVTWSAIGYGLAYACAWAFYILSSARTGRSVQGLDGFVVATCISAVLIFPLATSEIGYFFSSPSLIQMSILVAVLATLPLGLEYISLKRLPPRLFGVLLSLEPAIATITGIILLSEQLTLVSWFAIGVVSAASVGATLTRNAAVTSRQGTPDP